MKIKKILICLGCCIITLFSLVFVGCKRDTAKASIYSRSVLIELPSIAITIDGRSGFVPTMYFGRDDYLGLYNIYYLTSDTGFEPKYVVGYNGSNSEFIYYTCGIVGSDNVVSNMFVPLHDNGAYIRIYNNEVSYDELISNTTHINISFQNGTLSYELLDIDNNQTALILIGSLRLTEYAIMEYNYTCSLISTNVLYNQEVMLNNAYNNGYNDGYNVGYDTGHYDGIQVGFGATTPFQVVVNSVNNFLDIELFGGFKISTLLYISFGMILLGIVIKVFLGG